MSVLTDKQADFAEKVGNLLSFASLNRPIGQFANYRVRLDWVYRNKVANDSVSGHRRSLHLKRLAIDLIIDRYDENKGKWVYQTKETPFHKLLGEYWEAVGGSWGGRFGDPGHFSLPHGGMK